MSDVEIPETYVNSVAMYVKREGGVIVEAASFMRDGYDTEPVLSDSAEFKAFEASLIAARPGAPEPE